MFVYRIEREHGEGPYAHGFASRIARIDEDCWSGPQPTPISDKIADDDFGHDGMSDRGGRQCAFQTVAQLVSWFGPVDVEACASNGIYVSIIEVNGDDAKFGDFQVTIPRDAKRVGRIETTRSLLSLLKVQDILGVCDKAEAKYRNEFLWQGDLPEWAQRGLAALRNVPKLIERLQ